jgi:hypothetical protein
MLVLQRGHTNKLILTLTEKQTTVPAYYLFIFRNRGTREEVKFILEAGEDTSPFPGRYNMFPITTDVYFNNKSSGMWHYFVYGQDDNVNVDPALAEYGLLENGIMNLIPAVITVSTQYLGATGTTKVYNG